jgi:hypothetical protein
MLITSADVYLKDAPTFPAHAHQFYIKRDHPYYRTVVWRESTWENGRVIKDTSGYPIISTGPEMRRLERKEWHQLAVGKLKPRDFVPAFCGICKHLGEARQAATPQGQRELLAYFAQLCDAALLEALDYHF